MARNYPRLRLRGIPENWPFQQGVPIRPRRPLLAREVFRVAFYLPHDHADIAPGVSHAIDSYMGAVGEGPGTISYGHINHSEGSPLTAERWESLRRSLQNTTRRVFPDDFSERTQLDIEKRGFHLGLLLSGGPSHRNGYSLEYKARIPWRSDSETTAMSLLTATLPLDYLEVQGANRVRQLAYDMASKLLFASGHAGLALEVYRFLPLRDDAFRAEVLRHPGIDLRAAWSRQQWLGLRVDGVHWLNFLGSPLLAQFGGASGLRARLHSAETTLVDLSESRAAVSLGEEPELGDLSTGQFLPAYRELAQALEPWLEPLFLLPTTVSIESARYTSLRLTDFEACRWWRRFLD
jgi:hypothetical protein